MKNLILMTLTLISLNSFAGKTKVITMESILYAGSPQMVSEYLDSMLHRKMKVFCGSLDNVERIENYKVSLDISDINISENFGINHHKNPLFYSHAYPRGTGQATVTCRDENAQVLNEFI